MSSKRYTAEFRTEAIRQVTERGYPVREVAKRLGVSSFSLYKWLKGVNRTPRLVAQEDLRAENARLKAELKPSRRNETPEKGRRVLCQGIRVRYAFVAAHRREFRLTTMCRVLRMHRSGFCAWMRTPSSRRAIEDARLLGKMRTFYQASDGAYGSPRVHRDLREDGERCGEHHVARLMRINGLRAVRGYKKPRYRAGKPALLAPNRLEQNFSAMAPDRVWPTDITYIRTFEGWLYLAVVVDLYSRIVVEWSMKPALSRELVLDALLMAVWGRRPTQPVIVHSDQGSQYGSDDVVRFCKDHGLIPSMTCSTTSRSSTTGSPGTVTSAT